MSGVDTLATGREGKQQAAGGAPPPRPSSPSHTGAGLGRPSREKPGALTPASGLVCWKTHAETCHFCLAWGGGVFALFQLLPVSADIGLCSMGTEQPSVRPHFLLLMAGTPGVLLSGQKAVCLVAL